MPRKCPHGVDLGPLDDYGKTATDRVYSAYCEACDRDQTGACEACKGTGEWSDGFRCVSCSGDGVVKAQV